MNASEKKLLPVPKSRTETQAKMKSQRLFMLHLFSIAKDFSLNNKDSYMYWTSFTS